jgi:magnesium chelatase family protein
MDLLIEVPALSPAVLGESAPSEDSASVRARVLAAHARQAARQGMANARLGAGEVDRHAAASPAARQLLEQAAGRLDLSARAWHRVLKVARTIADLAASPTLERAHLAEALQYRRPFLPT